MAESIYDVFVSIALFVFVIAGGLAMLSAFVADDNTHINKANYSYFNTTFNQFDRLNASVSTLQNTLSTNTSTSQSIFGFFDMVVFKGWNVLSAIGGISSTFLGIVSSILGAIQTQFYIPAWATVTIVIIVLLTIIFGTLNYIFRRSP